MRTKPFLQPFDAKVLNELRTVARSDEWKSFLVLVAYATHAGVGQLIGAIRGAIDNFDAAQKTFLVGFDFGRTEPQALRDLQLLPNTVCRVFEPARALAAGLVPRDFYHPKLYVFGESESISTSRRIAGVVGSANLSYHALSKNVEVCVRFSGSEDSGPGRRWMTFVHACDAVAHQQPILTEELLAEYKRLRPQATIPRREPIPGKRTAAARQLGAALQRALRAASCFWTDGGKLSRNLGPTVPGNQVDLKLGSRAFFGSKVPMSTGFGPRNQNHLATVTTRVEDLPAVDRVLRLGHNQMEKLALPGPGGGYPASYDNQCLLWERLPDGSFRLHLHRDGRRWKAKSRRQRSIFKYRSRRQWGFFTGAP